MNNSTHQKNKNKMERERDLTAFCIWNLYWGSAEWPDSKYTSLQYLTHVIRTKLESTFRKWLKWHTQNQTKSTVAQSSLTTIYAYETRYGIASHYLWEVRHHVKLRIALADRQIISLWLHQTVGFNLQTPSSEFVSVVHSITHLANKIPQNLSP